ncbi:MAG: hypothetical protein DBY32_10945 [Phascolarctobacterium sp.]|nr:MAG: hypothetical protein DBY32_10945 [Phascolarctobacterium sp.]
MNLKYLYLMLLLYILPYCYYLFISHGLGHKAIYLQLRRFLPCSILAVLPIGLANIPANSSLFLSDFIIGLLWIVVYPFLYFLTYHKNSSDFGFHFDTVFGLYIIAWLTSLKILISQFNFLTIPLLLLVSIFEIILFLIPLIQVLYYIVYKICINDTAIALFFETDHNESIEFYKSLPKSLQILLPVIIISICSTFIYSNLYNTYAFLLDGWELYCIIAIMLFLTYYLWNPKKGVFIRTGFIELFLDVKKYLKETKKYKDLHKERFQQLTVHPSTPQFANPSTIIMVIGESASRDYMHAFSNYKENTTPWLSSQKDNKNFIIFPNIYACKDMTVPVLECVLTERNQYNNYKFYNSCSIIDIAKKAGYKTYWFSNQGHIGSAETAITLVANTADKAEWTKQNLNQVQYDGALLENLKTVNHNENNFIVLHLMGSHFNFINRYPQSFAKFSQPNKYDLIPNYLDSIAYTDYVLQQITDFAKQKLNLQTLLYFSDHATIPDKRRSPKFEGFATVRIPMFAYFSDKYIKKYPETYSILSNHKNNYFTNDLIYDLMCGILNISSNHYDETNSLTSQNYKYTRETLKTDLGNKWIKDDK